MKRMKLAKVHENCDCQSMLEKTDVCLPNKCHIVHEDTLDEYDGQALMLASAQRIGIEDAKTVYQVKRLLEEWELKDDLRNETNQLLQKIQNIVVGKGRKQ